MGCAHCDGSHPHEHAEPGDQVALVHRRARTLLRWTGLRVILLVAAVAGALALPGQPPGRAGVAVVGGLMSWAVATAAGLAVAGAVHRPGGPSAARSALALGSVATAALTPLTALAVAWAAAVPAPGASPRAAALAACGWLTAALAADASALLRMRSLLLSPGRPGENARAAALRSPDDRHGRHLAGTLTGAAVYGVAVGLLAVLPLLVLALAPLQAAVVARLALVRAAPVADGGRPPGLDAARAGGPAATLRT